MECWFVAWFSLLLASVVAAQTRSRVECPKGGRIPGGIINVSGEKRIFNCRGDYILLGESSITCDGNFFIGTLPRCYTTCPSAGSKFIAGFITAENETRTFTCREGYQLEGNRTITCDDGLFYGEVPRCKTLCPAQGIIPGGKMIESTNTPPLNSPLYKFIRNFANNIAQNYTCNEDYELEGNNPISCSAGERFYGEIPRCRTACPSANTKISGGNIVANGSTRMYTCKEGYELIGAATITCEGEHFYGDLPLCRAECPVQGVIPHGSINVSSDNTRMYTCEDGYQLVGPPTAQCEGDYFYGDLPSCEEDCSNQDDITAGKIITLANGNREYVCDSGYVLVGDRSVVCDQQGLLPTNVKPTCQKVTSPVVYVITSIVSTLAVSACIALVVFIAFIRLKGRKNSTTVSADVVQYDDVAPPELADACSVEIQNHHQQPLSVNVDDNFYDEIIVNSRRNFGVKDPKKEVEYLEIIG